MEKELLQLEQAVHTCTYVEIDGVEELRHLTGHLKNLIRQYRGEEEREVDLLQEVYAQVEDAERYLNTFRPDDLNINDWKYNLQVFSKAKAHMLYPLNLMRAALRFGRLHEPAAELVH